MTPAEQRLIDTAREWAACNDRYAKAQDAAAAAYTSGDDDLYERAAAALDKAYNDVVDAGCAAWNEDRRAAFETARMERTCAKDACRAAEAAYQLALQALSENPA